MRLHNHSRRQMLIQMNQIVYALLLLCPSSAPPSDVPSSRTHSQATEMMTQALPCLDSGWEETVGLVHLAAIQ